MERVDEMVVSCSAGASCYVLAPLPPSLGCIPYPLRWNLAGFVYLFDPTVIPLAVAAAHTWTLSHYLKELRAGSTTKAGS